jgi:hypothetical protein
MTHEMNKFLQELINGGSEGLYNCVGVYFPKILEGSLENVSGHATQPKGDYQMFPGI